MKKLAQISRCLRRFGGAVVADHVGAQTVARPAELFADRTVVAGTPCHVLRLHVLPEIAAVAREMAARKAGVARLQGGGAEAGHHLRPDLSTRQQI